MELNGDHGGNIMTATMPGVLDEYGQPVSVVDNYGQPASGDLWLTLIDGDHAWRQDSQTLTTQLYRYHRTDAGSEVEWEFQGLAAGTYKVQTDWMTNIAITDHGKFMAASNATYRIFSGSTELTSKVIHQNTFPEDETLGLDAWANLGEVTLATAGTLKVLLSTETSGDFVVAGRVRIMPPDHPENAQIITNQDAGYKESSAILFTWTPLSDPVNALSGGTLPQELVDLFATNGHGLVEPEFGIVSSGLPAPPDEYTEILNGLKALTISDSLLAKFKGHDINPGDNPAVSVVTSDKEWKITTDFTAYNEFIVKLEQTEDGEDVLNVYDPDNVTAFVWKDPAWSNKWLIVNTEWYRAEALTEAGATWERFRYGDKYTLTLSSGTISVSLNWDSIAYPSGYGNFPL